jgi:hypothetical protein
MSGHRLCHAISAHQVMQVIYANQNWATSIQGSGIEYPSIREWPLASELVHATRCRRGRKEWQCWGKPWRIGSAVWTR